MFSEQMMSMARCWELEHSIIESLKKHNVRVPSYIPWRVGSVSINTSRAQQYLRVNSVVLLAIATDHSTKNGSNHNKTKLYSFFSWLSWAWLFARTCTVLYCVFMWWCDLLRNRTIILIVRSCGYSSSALDGLQTCEFPGCSLIVKLNVALNLPLYHWSHGDQRATAVWYNKSLVVLCLGTKGFIGKFPARDECKR